MVPWYSSHQGQSPSSPGIQSQSPGGGSVFCHGHEVRSPAITAHFFKLRAKLQLGVLYKSHLIDFDIINRCTWGIVCCCSGCDVR